jgi:hypothetical protein
MDRAQGERKMMQRSRPWSPADDDLLRALAMRGLSEGEIAEQMDRSKSSVRSRAAKIQVAIARDRNGMQKPQRSVGLTGRKRRIGTPPNDQPTTTQVQQGPPFNQSDPN